jgi:hypothetical protein
MRAHHFGLPVVGLLLALGSLVLLAPGSGATTSEMPQPGYLALGDSLSLGVGASERDGTGFVALFHQFLAPR